jgi:methyltransferase (TIGR00027 family)
MKLSDVSQTAVYTLICRVTQAEKKNPIISDPMASLCLENMFSLASDEDKRRILKWKKMVGGLGSIDAKWIAQRAIAMDGIVNEYISNNPSCTVITLGCGFDTRFWRINNSKCRYIELDLPETLEFKKEILKDHLSFEQIGCSVLDTTWIDKVTSAGNSNFLLVAEGLFMYLPKPEAARLLQEIAQRFSRSQFVLDMVPEKYTKGFGQKLVAWQFKLFMGVDAPWVFGIKDPRGFESYGSGFNVIDVKKAGTFVITLSVNENA